MFFPPWAFHSTAHPFLCLYLLSMQLLLIPDNLVFDCRALDGFKDVSVLLSRLQANPLPPPRPPPFKCTEHAACLREPWALPLPCSPSRGALGAAGLQPHSRHRWFTQSAGQVQTSLICIPTSSASRPGLPPHPTLLSRISPLLFLLSLR